MLPSGKRIDQKIQKGLNLDDPRSLRITGMFFHHLLCMPHYRSLGVLKKHSLFPSEMPARLRRLVRQLFNW